MTACCQITCAIPWLPCEQLPYPPEHPRISRMWRRDKSDLPLPVFSYKYFLLWYSFSILSFYSPKSTLTAAAPSEVSKNFNKVSLHQPLSLWSSSLQGDGHQLRCSWGQLTTLSPALLLYSYSSAIGLTKYSFFFLFFFLPSKTSRIWPIRSLFLPINLTSNVLAR